MSKSIEKPVVSKEASGSKLKIKSIYIILIAGIMFNLTKNINRINNLNSYEKFPFPKTMKIDFKTNYVNNIELNTPLGKKDHKSFLCWDIPIYCRIGGFEGIRIDKIGTYIIFIAK